MRATKQGKREKLLSVKQTRTLRSLSLRSALSPSSRVSYEKLKKSVAARLSGEKPEDTAATQESAPLPDSELYPLLARADSELTPSAAQKHSSRELIVLPAWLSILIFFPALVCISLCVSDELKEKSKQKRLKSLADAQQARRREKEARVAAERLAAEQEQAAFESNPDAFLSDLRRQREALLTAREERQRTENESTGGRRSLASKRRMALLASMGGSGGSVEAIEKAARKDKASFEREASFGMKDEDWNVYDEVRQPAELERNESDEEREAIAKIESKIALYDPQG